MSVMSRRKGAAYEREICAILRDAGHKVNRNLDQVRDGGGDIPFGDFLIECKRRAALAVYEWMDQCIRATALDPAGRKPCVVMRGDKRDNLVVLRLTDFLELVNRTPPSTQGCSARHEQG